MHRKHSTPRSPRNTPTPDVCRGKPSSPSLQQLQAVWYARRAGCSLGWLRVGSPGSCAAAGARASDGRVGALRGAL
jgi:hypothetical protein